MNIKSLIPKDKSDIETAEKLKNYSYQELKSIIPDLLIWLQDGNWPVAKIVLEYLESICDNISEEIFDVFKTNDLEWKYWIILSFGPITNDGFIRNEIVRIALNPTKLEIEYNLNEVANEIMLRRNWN
jgi:hypothetical protein